MTKQDELLLTLIGIVRLIYLCPYSYRQEDGSLDTHCLEWANQIMEVFKNIHNEQMKKTINLSIERPDFLIVDACAKDRTPPIEIKEG